MARPKGSQNTQPSSDAKREMMCKLRREADKGDTLAAGILLIVDALQAGTKNRDRPHG